MEANKEEEAMLFALVDYLDQTRHGTEELEIITQCLNQLYKVDFDNVEKRESARKERESRSLLEMFQSASGGLKKNAIGSGMSMDTSTPSSSVEVPDLAAARNAAFEKFLGSLRKTKFFEGVTEGTPEYEERVGKARVKFEQKYGGGGAAAASNTASVPSTDPAAKAPVSAEVFAQAEEFKQKGNEALKAEKYQDALSLYTKAIELYPDNAVYLSNRAAAKIYLEKYLSAIDDCKKAISLDGKYIRARERLANSYRYLGMLDEEIQTLEDALKLDPENAKLKSDLQGAKQRKNPSSSTNMSSSSSSRGMPGAAGGAPPPFPGPAGMPDLAGIMSNPMFAQMASQLMSDPQAMQQAMSMFGGMFGGAADGPGGMSPPGPTAQADEEVEMSNEEGVNPSTNPRSSGPDLSGLLNNPALRESLRSNPQLASMAEELRRDPSALNNILSDPDSMRNIMSAATTMFGQAPPPPGDEEDDGGGDHQTYYS